MRISIIYFLFVLLLSGSCSKDTEYEITHLDETWHYFDHFDTDKPALEITSICMDMKNNIWASVVWDSSYTVDSFYMCSHNGCMWYKIDTFIYSSYIIKIHGKNVLDILDKSIITDLDHTVSAIGFNKNNNLYIGTSVGNGIIELQGQTKNLYNPPGGLGYPYEKFIFDSDNNLWFGAGNGGLYKFNDGIFTVFNRANSIMPYPEVVQFISFDSRGIVWFNTPEDLVKLENNTLEIIPFHYHQLIYASFIDNEDKVWIIANSQLKDNIELKKISYNSSDQYATSEDIILTPEIEWLFLTDLAVDSKNNIWITTKFQGLLMFDQKTWTYYNTSNSQIHSNNLTTLFIDKYDNIWLGSAESGLAVFNLDGISYK